MPRTTATLAKDIDITLSLIDQQMLVLAEQAQANGTTSAKLQNMNGEYPVIPLLLARASVLSAEATMKSLEKK